MKGKKEGVVEDALPEDSRQISRSWIASITEEVREGLPIIENGKVIRNMVNGRRSSKDGEPSSEEGQEDEWGRDRTRDRSRKETKREDKDKEEECSEDKEGTEVESDDDEEDFDFENDVSLLSEDDDGSDQEGSAEDQLEQQQDHQELTAKATKDSNKLSKMAQLTLRKMTVLATKSEAYIKGYVATICRAVLSSPEESLKKRGNVQSTSNLDLGNERNEYKLLDLFEILTANKNQKMHGTGGALFSETVVEATMLSLLLLFKDICPGYKIRASDERSETKDVRLKKETRRKRNFELALLGAYQRYLKFLDENVNSLQSRYSDAKKGNGWSKIQLMGLSALRCQCELLHALPNFNFRKKLLKSVIYYGMVAVDEISTVSIQSIELIFKMERNWNLIADTVRLMTTYLNNKSSTTHVPEAFVKTLFSLKLKVRADDAKELNTQAKKNRRKRKRASKDDAAVQLQESNTQYELVLRDKAQAECLADVILIYFRIIKGKSGFRLMPTALEGLGKISHLINIDTVEDLILMMKTLLQKNDPPIPVEVQLQCILCALRTLSGPGDSLDMDTDFFCSSLLNIIHSLTFSSPYWSQVLECVDICIIRKREERNAPILKFASALLKTAPHLLTKEGFTNMMSIVHRMFLRYPRIRQRLSIFTPLVEKTMEDDDEVTDLAMSALNKSLAEQVQKVDAFSVTSVGANDDGTWVMPLLRHNMDPLWHRIAAIVSSREISILPNTPTFSQGEELTELWAHMKRAFENAKRIKNETSKKFSKEKRGGGSGRTAVVAAGKKKKRNKK